MEELVIDNGEIVRHYGDINVVIDPHEYLAFIQRVSTGQGIVFHLEADFYREWPEQPVDLVGLPTVESGFVKWRNEAGWRLQYTNDVGEVTNQVDLSEDEYEKINRFFMRFRAGTL